MKAVDAYILSNQYTDDTANQFGGLKGANCQFSATETSDGHRNTYTWKNDNDETQTSSYVVKDGAKGDKGDTGAAGADGQNGANGADGRGIKSVDINSNNHLIITYDDDTTHDAGTLSSSGGGTLVVANPILTGTEDEITAIQIGDVKFVVPTTNPSALTPAQITLLEAVLDDCVYADSSGQAKVDALITSLRNGETKELSSISAVKQVVTYETGATLDLSDITVTATYSDNSTANVTSNPNTVIDDSDVDMNTEGTYIIDVTYTENNVTKATSITVTVANAVVVELTSVSATKTKTSYTTTQTWSTSDITVTAHYSNGTSDDVTSDQNTVIDDSNVDITTAGNYSVGISYTENGITKTTSIAITVIADTGTVIYSKASLTGTTNNADLRFGTKIDAVSGRQYKYVFDYEVLTGGLISLRSEAPAQEFLVTGNLATGATGHVEKKITATQTRNREPFILKYENNADTSVKLTNITITEYTE